MIWGVELTEETLSQLEIEDALAVEMSQLSLNAMSGTDTGDYEGESFGSKQGDADFGRLRQFSQFCELLLPTQDQYTVPRDHTNACPGGQWGNDHALPKGVKVGMVGSGIHLSY
jgi:hypothetical protein